MSRAVFAYVLGLAAFCFVIAASNPLHQNPITVMSLMTDTSSTLDAASPNVQHFAASVHLIYSPIYFLIVKLKQLPKGMTSCIVHPTICSDLL
uniref:Uncharacterized protein n=1 Tax=Daphnia galeata TaxID=27404 RepID=A0A8J2RKE2_9CRUS|nr:unnamed protein product [Daphnia galeata]